MPDSPSVPLRRLAAEMAALRDRAALTQQDVYERARISQVALSRLENGHSRPREATLLALLNLYDVNDKERDRILALHKAAGQPQTGWLTRHVRGVSDKYSTFVQFESEARTASVWSGQVVPGLLQTQEYARSIIGADGPAMAQDDVDALADARMARQLVLRRTRPLRLDALIDEAVLRRPVGGRDVMRNQLQHLLTFSDSGHVSLRVVPESAGAHPGLKGSFSVLAFEAANPIVYLEQLGGDVFLDAQEDVDQFRTAFDILTKLALDREETNAMVAKMARKSK